MYFVIVNSILTGGRLLGEFQENLRLVTERPGKYAETGLERRENTIASIALASLFQKQVVEGNCTRPWRKNRGRK